MQPYRNIQRAFAFNKGTKTAPVDRLSIWLLFCVSVGQNTCLKCYAYLKRFRRADSTNRIHDRLKDMSEAGYLLRSGSRYSLTMEGINLLNDLEKRIRETRYDK